MTMHQRESAVCECGDHAFARTNRWGVVLVSPEDQQIVANYNLSLSRQKRSFYAQSSLLYYETGSGLLHRSILDCEIPDHRNGNGLDNRRSNLRVATGSQNNQNSRKRCGTLSRFKGVSWRQDRSYWRAYIVVNGKQRALGTFQCELEAAAAYDRAALTHFGEFAKLNFPKVT